MNCASHSPGQSLTEWETASSPTHIVSCAPSPNASWSLIACLIILSPASMDWLLFLLFPGALLVLCWSSTEGESRGREAEGAR